MELAIYRQTQNVCEYDTTVAEKGHRRVSDVHGFGRRENILIFYRCCNKLPQTW